MKTLKRMLVILSFVLFALRFFLEQTHMEYRWVELEVLAEAMFPLYLIYLIVKLTLKISKSVLRKIVMLLLVAGSIFGGFIYFVIKPSVIEHTYKSPSGKQVLIVKNQGWLSTDWVYFFCPRFVILKEYIWEENAHYPVIGSASAVDDNYQVIWNNDESQCTISWVSDEIEKYESSFRLNINEMHGTSNQRVDPTVKTPVESGNVQGTAGHP
jgi:hypothetical protein